MSEIKTPVVITIKIGSLTMYHYDDVDREKLENDTEAQLEKISQDCKNKLLGGSHRFKP